MTKNIYEPDELYRLSRTGGENLLVGTNFRLRRQIFRSRWTDFLIQEDQSITENRIFNYLILEPIDQPPLKKKGALIIFHGLNEGSYGQILPWASSFIRQINLPVILFPLSFHVGRRSSLWNSKNQSRTAYQRFRIPGNNKVSLFNSRISERLSESPERYYLGGLQSYLDALDLVTQIHTGNHPLYEVGSKVHFLGYSAGGYMALILLLSQLNDFFSNSRAILFSSGAPLDGINPESIFIMDSLAARNLHAYLRNKSFLTNSFDAEQWKLFEKPTHWLEQILIKGNELENRMKLIHDRVLLVVNPKDKVISAAQSILNLAPAKTLHLDLGVHEFPFKTAEPLPDVYDRKKTETRVMLENIRNIHHIAPDYRAVFDKFIHKVSNFIVT